MASITDQTSEDDTARLMFAFAHDLRGYLRTMHTRIQLVQRKAPSLLPEEENRWLLEAGTAGDDMARLIGAMVAYCSVGPVAEVMPLGLMLRGVRMEAKGILTEAAAQLFIADAVEAEISRSLSVVLMELLTNSCRFRRRDLNSEIRIATRMPDPQTAEVVVKDNGTGVAAEFLEKLFLPFRRMHSRNDYPGFGLGLALCRKIVTANGGSIDASLPDEGGLAIRVLMPARAIV
jgi:light-regulated signal transduction histidine kinase (bacteriophytochrome)